MGRGFVVGLASLAIAAVLPAAAQAQNAANGAKVFSKCAVCHAVAPEKRGGLGPNLFGVVGRKAATLPGFIYSPAMKKSGLTWGQATLDRYIEKPQATVPGTRMAYGGVANPQERRDLIAYLTSLKAK